MLQLYKATTNKSSSSAVEQAIKGVIMDTRQNPVCQFELVML
jgi:hypothetical protein